MDYCSEIKEKLIDNEIYTKVKDYSKERHKVLTYFEIGKLLYEAGSVYGENIIGKYAHRLMNEVGKKYNKRTLFRIRQFYILFQDEKVSTLSTQLSWSHYSEILVINDIEKRHYYINIVLQHNLSVRELRSRIKSCEYERLDNNTKLKLIKNEKTTIGDNIKHPIIIKNKFNTNEISEKMLKRLILEDIFNFMRELGNGFSLIDSEYKIKIGNSYNYIDLLLFNILYNCYVVIELKVTEFKKEYVGQIEIYMNYIDKHIKKIYHDKTIGIIITKVGNEFMIRYCSDERIYNTTYMLV